MGDVYKVNLTWTSPLVTYEPSGAWRQAATMYNESTATFSFYGNALKWFGSTNSSTYTISLDNVPQTVQPRKFVPLVEGPTDVWCNATIPWECMVLAEFDGLDPTIQHSVQLRTDFNQTGLGVDTVNLLALQVSYNTSQPENTIIRNDKVDMDSSRLIFAGDWSNITYDPNIYKRSVTPGSTISLPFRAYSISVWGTNDISTSDYSISLDGNAQSFSFPEVSSKDKEVLLWYKAGLDQNTQHTVVVTNQGTSGLIIGGFKTASLVDPLHPPDDSDSYKDGSKALSGGAIAGIVIGALFGLFLLIAYILYRRILHKRAKETNANGTGTQANSRLSLRGLLGGGGSSSVGHISPWEDPRNVEAQPSQPTLPVVATVSQQPVTYAMPPYQPGEIPTEQPPPFEQHQSTHPIITTLVSTNGSTNNTGSPTTPTSTHQHQPIRKERLTMQPSNTTRPSSRGGSAAGLNGGGAANNGSPAVVVVDADVPADNLAQRERGSVSTASGHANGNGDNGGGGGAVAQRKPALFPPATPPTSNNNNNNNATTNTNGNNNSNNTANAVVVAAGQTTPRSPISPASETHPHAQENEVVGRTSPDANRMLSPTTASSHAPGAGAGGAGAATAAATGTGDANDASRRNTHQTTTTVNTTTTPPARRDSTPNNNAAVAAAIIEGGDGNEVAGGDNEADPPPAYEGPSPQDQAQGGSSSNAAQRRREARDRKTATAEPRTLGVTND